MRGTPSTWATATRSSQLSWNTRERRWRVAGWWRSSATPPTPTTTGWTARACWPCWTTASRSDAAARTTDVLPYGRQTIEDDDIAAVAEALRGDFLTTGPTVEA